MPQGGRAVRLLARATAQALAGALACHRGLGYGRGMPAIPERHLFGPGPSNPYPEATAALGLPLLGHLDPEFLRIMDETCERLRTVWGLSLIHI